MHGKYSFIAGKLPLALRRNQWLEQIHRSSCLTSSCSWTNSCMYTWTDCGVPTRFEDPLECDQCTVCCEYSDVSRLPHDCMILVFYCPSLAHVGNVEGNCHVTTEILAKESRSFAFWSLAFSLVCIAFFCLVSILARVYHKKSYHSSAPQQNEPPQQNKRRHSFVHRQTLVLLKARALDSIGEGE